MTRADKKNRFERRINTMRFLAMLLYLDLISHATYNKTSDMVIYDRTNN